MAGGSSHERNKETMCLLPQSITVLILERRRSRNPVPPPLATANANKKPNPGISRRTRLFPWPLRPSKGLVGGSPGVFEGLPGLTPGTSGQKAPSKPASPPADEGDSRGYTSHDALTESPGPAEPPWRGYTRHDPAPPRRTLGRSVRGTPRGYTSSEFLFGRDPVRYRHGFRTLGKHTPSSLEHLSRRRARIKRSPGHGAVGLSRPRWPAQKWVLPTRRSFQIGRL
jgi:hypothetical protein